VFKHPRYGTNCAKCQNHIRDGQARSEFPASTVCQWCIAALCSLHAQAPFGYTNSVRACRDCADAVKRQHDEHGNLVIQKWVANAWIERYSTDTFRGYAK
jgi:hypothetical protein